MALSQRAEALPPSFDFFAATPDEPRLDATCANLQSDPESMFRQNLICQRPGRNGGYSLLGRVLKPLPDGEKRVIDTAEELYQVLAEHFGLVIEPAPELWPQLVARHEELFADLQ